MGIGYMTITEIEDTLAKYKYLIFQYEQREKEIRKLHKQINGPADDITCSHCAYDIDWYPEYPCPTIKILDGIK